MNNTETARTAEIAPNKKRAIIRPATITALSLIFAWLLLTIISACFYRSLEFDGAMNLAVAKNLSEGHGPREIYDSRDLFPFEVQTRGPYLWLGAAVFRLFGVGPFQTQLPNLIFVVLLGAVLFTGLRRAFGLATALLGCVLVFSTPSFIQYGLRGYGELPTFFFGLAALAIIAGPETLCDKLPRKTYVAGVLAALAVATKIIGVSELAMVGAVMLVRVTMESRAKLRDLAKGCGFFAAGVITSLAAVELWRLYWLGAADYVAWWQFQWTQIRGQSGAGAHFLGGSIWSKIARHFGFFSRHVGASAIETSFLIAAPVAAVACAYFCSFSKEQRSRSRWLILGISLITALYFIWWMAIVPDNKASLRYVYIGLIGLEILAAISLISNFWAAIKCKNTALRLIHASLAASIVYLYYPPVVKAFDRPISFKPDAELSTTRQAAQIISSLPRDRKILGFGWYSAPTIQIYSDRRFIDLTDWPIGKLVDQPAYLIADRPSLVTGILHRVLARYPHKELMQPSRFAQIYEVDFSHPHDPFLSRDDAKVLSWIAFDAKNYPYTEGMEPFDPIGGRFIESDSEVLLRYTGQGHFQLTGYMDAAIPSYYRFTTPISGKIFIGHCPPLEFAFDKPGWKDFKLSLTCKPQQDSDIRVRVLLDNTMDLPWLRDRQRAMLMSKVGFID